MAVSAPQRIVSHDDPDVIKYRASPQERQRENSLLSLLPDRGESVLDIGARDGHYSRALAKRFDRVVALDLERPSISYPRVECVVGDVTDLEYGTNSFDWVLCAEVLEHIPNWYKACEEMTRVARNVVIGVPHNQDIRKNRSICDQCGVVNPPWGHVNSFPKGKIARAMRKCDLRKVDYVGAHKNRTNWLSDRLMRGAGYPYGTWHQREGCVKCGATLVPPTDSWPFSTRLQCGLAVQLDRVQSALSCSRPRWAHYHFERRSK